MSRAENANQAAKNNPVIINKTFEASEQDIGNPEPRLLKSTGLSQDALEPSIIATVDRPINAEKLAMLAFMAELVTVRIATTTDKNAEQVFEITLGGKIFLFKRGESKTVPRYVADKLCRTKETGYESQEVTNSAGIRDVLYTPSTALRYDFSIVRDDNPHGASWHKAALAGF